MIVEVLDAGVLCMLAKGLGEIQADEAFAAYFAKFTFQSGVTKISVIDCAEILTVLRVMIPSLTDHIQTIRVSSR